MATVLSTLYPPLVDTFQPSFLYTEDAKVVFTISPYNSYKEIKRLHVTLVNQRTNQNVFANSNLTDDDETVLTSGVWIVPFDISNDNPYLSGNHIKNYYTLTIPSSLLKQTETQTESSGYVCDCYYKVQIRFDNYSLKDGENIDNLYLHSKRASFSEWSAVTLLKAIPEITVKLTNFTLDSEKDEVRIPQYNPGIIPFTGSVFFTPTNTEEHLESFTIEITDDEENILKQSGLQYITEKINTFSWLCDLTDALVNQNYYVNLYLTTNNNYTVFKRYKFRLVESNNLEFEPIWDFNKIKLPYNSNEQVLVTSEDGWVTITITIPGLLPPGYLFIKRANSLNQYADWEIIDCSYFADGTQIVRTFIDKTVGSLINYKYSCQYLTTSNLWSKTIKTNEIVFPDFHDILILRGDRQLAIRYNGQITSMTPVVNRVKIDTLGGRYPRFAENARLHYKQFQLNGIISAEADYNRKFISDLDYKDEMTIYDKRMNGKHSLRNDTFIDSSGDHDTYPTDNWWWERKFREEAIEWLNDGEPKLYRSMTEGNMIVIFDSVSLTPNQQLGRRIWNFSATVYEVEDGYSLTSLNSLGIFKVKNDYNSNNYGISEKTSLFKTWIGQFRDYSSNNSVINLMEKIQDYYAGTYNNYEVDKNSVYLTDIAISFNSRPQWYDLTSLNLKSQDNEDLSLSFGDKKYELRYNDELKQYVVN